MASCLRARVRYSRFASKALLSTTAATFASAEGYCVTDLCLHVSECLATAEEPSAEYIGSAQKNTPINDQVWKDFVIYLVGFFVVSGFVVAVTLVKCFIPEEVELVGNVSKEAFI